MALWIVVTGLDGSGKTTMVDELADFLTSQGKRVFRDRFPHDPYLTKKLLNESKDRYTDRLLFALDNRLTCQRIQDAMDSGDYDYVITQRGLLDSFVHGAVKKFSYDWIAQLNQVDDLPKCQIMIHMVADARIAYSRIKDDPEADKFEYPAYMDEQERQTRRAYTEVISGINPALVCFKDSLNIYVDTTEMSIPEVFEYVKSRLEKLNIL